jgi:L-threonylcarbamoyladenylate synthase
MNEKIFIYPTDTVFGIGTSIYDQTSLEYILNVKKSDLNKPTSIIFNDKNIALMYLKRKIIFEKIYNMGLFDLEITLCLDQSLFKLNEIPSWIYQDSRFIAIRLLTNNTIEKIVSIVKAPITTTSLNLSKLKPIVNYKEALLFKDKYFPESYMDVVLNEKQLNMSGNSSTIISVIEDLNGKYKIDYIRQGVYFDKIKNKLQLLST